MSHPQKINPTAVLAEVRSANCDKHGAYESRKSTFVGREIWTDCPACFEDFGKQQVRDQELARREAARAKIMQNAAIPPRFSNRKLDNYAAETPGQKRALEISLAYAENFADALGNGRSMVFCGTPGTGKTHLAVGIAHSVIAQGYTASFTTAMDAIRTVRETYRKGNEKTEREVISQFAEPDLMIIDEVGSQLNTEAEKVTLFDLINARYQAMKPMIVMSNLTISEVEQYIGERAFDRLRENGGHAVVFNWPSFRRGSK